MTSLSHDLKADMAKFAFPDEAYEGEIFDQLEPFIETLDSEPIEATTSEARKIRISQDQEGDITLATTRKLPNIRFRLKDAVIRGLPEVGLGTIESMDQHLLIPFLCLKFLLFIQELSTLSIDRLDAKVLTELFKFKFEEGMISLDEFLSYMSDKIDHNTLEESLNRLEHLKCITRFDGEILLNEEIVIESVQ